MKRLCLFINILILLSIAVPHGIFAQNNVFLAPRSIFPSNEKSVVHFNVIKENPSLESLLEEIPEWKNSFKKIELTKFSTFDSKIIKTASIIKVLTDTTDTGRENLLKNMKGRSNYSTILNLAESLALKLSPGNEYDPRAFYNEIKNSGMAPYSHLIFELAKLYYLNEKQLNVLDEAYQSFFLYLCPVKPKGRYHVSFLENALKIFYSGKFNRSKRKNMSGAGIYYFRVHDKNDPFSSFLAHLTNKNKEAEDYPISTFKMGKPQAETYPFVIEIKPNAPQGQVAIGFAEKLGKTGELIPNTDLLPHQFNYLININHLNLEANKKLKNHLILKGIISIKNNIIVLKSGEKLENGWVKLEYSDVSPEIQFVEYNKNDENIKKLSDFISNELKLELLNNKMEVKTLTDTGSSSRGYTVNAPDLDLMIEVNSQDFHELDKTTELLKEFLEKKRKELGVVYGDGISIELKGNPHQVGESNQYLFPFVFKKNDKEVGGIDFNFIFRSENSSRENNGIIYLKKHQDQINKILRLEQDNELFESREEMEQHLATQIKTLKKLLMDLDFYKTDDIETKRLFKGVVVEQLVLSLIDLLPIQNLKLSKDEVKDIFSLESMFFILSRLVKNGTSYYFPTVNSKIDKNEINFELIIDSNNLLTKLKYGIFDTFIDISKNFVRQSNKENSFLKKFNRLDSSKKMSLIEYVIKQENELNATIALKRVLPKLSFASRWELVQHIYTNYDSTIFSQLKAKKMAEDRILAFSSKFINLKNKLERINPQNAKTNSINALKNFINNLPEQHIINRSFLDYFRYAETKPSTEGFIEYLTTTVSEEEFLEIMLLFEDNFLSLSNFGVTPANVESKLKGAFKSQAALKSIQSLLTFTKNMSKQKNRFSDEFAKELYEILSKQIGKENVVLIQNEVSGHSFFVLTINNQSFLFDYNFDEILPDFPFENTSSFVYPLDKGPELEDSYAFISFPNELFWLKNHFGVGVNVSKKQSKSIKNTSNQELIDGIIRNNEKHKSALKALKDSFDNKALSGRERKEIESQHVKIISAIKNELLKDLQSAEKNKLISLGITTKFFNIFEKEKLAAIKNSNRLISRLNSIESLFKLKKTKSLDKELSQKRKAREATGKSS